MYIIRIDNKDKTYTIGYCKLDSDGKWSDSPTNRPNAKRMKKYKTALINKESLESVYGEYFSFTICKTKVKGK